jgi:hypothetical protein
VAPAELAFAACLAAVHFVPWLAQRPDPLRALAWTALSTPTLGCLVATRASQVLGAGLLLPGAAMLVIVLQDASSEVDLPGPLWAALALAGLHWIGLAAGRLGSRNPWSTSAAVLLLTLGLTALPSLGGLVRAPWPPVFAARSLDLSPVVFVEECAGVDWMRHAAVYSAVGTDSIGPELRTPWRGRLAGPFCIRMQTCR